MIPNLDQLILICVFAFACAAGIVWLIMRFTSDDQRDDSTTED